METISISRNSSSLIILTKHSLPSTRHNQIFLPQRRGSLSFSPISCSTSDSSNTKEEEDANSVQAPTATPPSAVEISFRRRSRRQAQRLKENNGAVSNSVQSVKAKVNESPKKWEEMSLSEKAIELYVGEKGALFWLNKFAYASIFIMIGGWIFFRFLGPALNLYQLDAPVLSPTDVFN
ncbi:hypothetical protein VNO77_02164 [Canavalia gladiata]|uniref:Uncharacterized protein n=1 Tax=Canavalia gladiata TaxID=3824 RepID=A0AAN9R5N5_CANGL